jgi:hypothetical protein
MIESPLAMSVVFHLGPIPVTAPVLVSWGIMACFTMPGSGSHGSAFTARASVSASSGSGRSRSRRYLPAAHGC